LLRQFSVELIPTCLELPTSENRLESKDDLGVELAPNSLSKPHAGDSTRHRVAIRPVGGHGVIGIRDGDDPREKRNVVSSKTVWISLAINSFVMMADDGCDFSVVIDLRENALSNLRVLFHLPSLSERERTRLLEQAGREPDLSHVVD